MKRMLGVALVALAALGMLTAHATSAPPTVAACDQIIDSAASPPDDYRVLFGRVAVPPKRLTQIVRWRTGHFRYWRKVGLVILAGDTTVTVSVPRAWRSRLAITWGNAGVVSTLRFEGCPSPEGVWNAYAGGFYLLKPACVPLNVRVGRQTGTVRFGIGASCS